MAESGVVITWQGGGRFNADARGHGVVIDQPKDEGGSDEGMAPLECLAVSLGSCVGFFAARFAQRHGAALEALRVDVTWDYAERPHRVGRFDVRLTYRGAIDQSMRDRLLAVARGCTVHHTLTHPPEVNVTLNDELSA
jgi:uncharacterized OsmC-like protein